MVSKLVRFSPNTGHCQVRKSEKSSSTRSNSVEVHWRNCSFEFIRSSVQSSLSCGCMEQLVYSYVLPLLPNKLEVNDKESSSSKRKVLVQFKFSLHITPFSSDSSKNKFTWSSAEIHYPVDVWNGYRTCCCVVPLLSNELGEWQRGSSNSKFMFMFTLHLTPFSSGLSKN